jgi:multidrug efflux pump subunit AcrA (membrane-fusion protein)
VTRVRTRASWLVYALAALAAGAIAAAILVVGPASDSQATATRTATAARGVVQSTVSGSGNVNPASELDLGFKTAGTVAQIYVTHGEHVTQGQLLATLDPQSAEVTLQQAKASRQSAEANLASEQESDGESSAGASSSASGTTAESKTAAPQSGGSSTTSATQGSGTGSAASSNASLSSAAREANIASARATVKSARLVVQSDEQAVENTKLVAPESGTIVSLSGQLGETVSASGTTKASTGSSGESASSAASSSGSSSSGAGAGSTGTSGTSGSSSSASSSFAVLSDLSKMQLVVALSESEVGSVRHGQPATVTVEALNGRKLAAHVSEVATLATSNSGVVSYDVTFQLDQLEKGLKPGMSATAEVVVKQAEGVNVPSSAISAGAVTVLRSGKQVRQPVTTGLAGNSSTIILSGLKAGEVVLLPTASGSSTSGLTSKLGSRLGRSGALGGGFAGGGLAGGGGFRTGGAGGPGPGG